jgi:chaperonin cofactor prefoldin
VNVGIGLTAPTFTLHVNGTVAGTSAYNNLSDARFKREITPIMGALSKINSLRGITHYWDNTLDKNLKLDDKRHYGFIAQEIEKVLPEVVNTANDSLGTKTVEYSSVVPVLVEAIKELTNKIEALEKENEALKSTNSALESKLTTVESNQSTILKDLASLKALLIGDQNAIRKSSTGTSAISTSPEKQ